MNLPGDPAEWSVSVVVPARNAAATLGATLTALEAQDVGVPFEVVVVDDASTDDTRKVAQASPLAPRIVEPAGPGAAAARNAGAAATDSEIIAFTDADCEPEPGWLAAGLAALASADLVQGAVKPVRQLDHPFARSLVVDRDRGLFESANLFVRREVYERLGGFEQWIGGRDERPFGEDTWFGWRAVRAGARYAFSEAPVVRHAVFPGRWRDLVKERWRLRYFPVQVQRMPELRDYGYQSVFLNRRTAYFDLALAGLLTALRRRSPAPLLMAVPYVRLTYGVSWIWGRRRLPMLMSAHALADAVGCLALATGSARSGTVVL